MFESVLERTLNLRVTIQDVVRRMNFSKQALDYFETYCARALKMWIHLDIRFFFSNSFLENLCERYKRLSLYKP